MYNIQFLPKSDDLFWMEEVISNLLGVISKKHDSEHSEMMEHWNLEYRNMHPITSEWNEAEKTWIPNRKYHLQLHIKFWHEKSMNSEYVERYKLFNGNPDDIPVPVIPTPQEV